MKTRLEILFYIIAIISSILACIRWCYKFMQRKALQETQLPSQATIENDLKIVYRKDWFMQFLKQHLLLYICCFIWFGHILYLSWRKTICYFKQEKDI